MSRTAVGIEERFWPKVDITPGCWEWTAARLAGSGYGRLRLGSEGEPSHTGAHRVSYEIHFGPIPDGLLVRHKCDNPPCVNPSHLELGTPADNMRDKSERGRCNSRRGESHAQSKLTLEQVLDIRSSDRSATELASIYGVSQSNISLIRTGKAWSWARES